MSELVEAGLQGAEKAWGQCMAWKREDVSGGGQRAVVQEREQLTWCTPWAHLARDRAEEQGLGSCRQPFPGRPSETSTPGEKGEGSQPTCSAVDFSHLVPSSGSQSNQQSSTITITVAFKNVSTLDLLLYKLYMLIILKFAKCRQVRRCAEHPKSQSVIFLAGSGPSL